MILPLFLSALAVDRGFFLHVTKLLVKADRDALHSALECITIGLPYSVTLIPNFSWGTISAKLSFQLPSAIQTKLKGSFEDALREVLTQHFLDSVPGGLGLFAVLVNALNVVRGDLPKLL